MVALLEGVHERLPCVRVKRDATRLPVGGVPNEHFAVAVADLYARSAVAVTVSGFAPVAHIASTFRSIAAVSDIR